MKRQLMTQGLFPETVPPCFTSADWPRAFRGLSRTLADKQFHQKRTAHSLPYNGTKHDGNRRPYATAHPISYHYICDFVDRNWRTFSKQFDRSDYSLSSPRPAPAAAERSIVVTPLSEVSSQAGKKIRHSAFVLKADIAQFYPSLYTHSISWAAHGKATAKADRAAKSSKNRFNALDFFVQNAQDGQSRGLLIGPDAYRVIAEFVAVQVDVELKRRAGNLIVGAARHVDDFYIGVRTEADAVAALAHLRDALREYELHVNDLKTKIVAGTEPLDDMWASRLRTLSEGFEENKSEVRIAAFFDEALSIAKQANSQSAIKLAVRRADKYELYRDPHFEVIESYLQRMVFHFPHAVDYICLLIAKRFALGETVDNAGWSEVAQSGLRRHILLGNDHEACWLFWLIIVCRLEISAELLDEITKRSNEYLKAMLLQATVDGLIAPSRRLTFGNKLASTDRSWLVNLVAKANGVTKAPFSGAYSEECTHLAEKGLVLVDFGTHIQKVSHSDTRAISNTRFGYEDDDDSQAGFESDDVTNALEWFNQEFGLEGE